MIFPFFREKNSLILAYDHLDDRGVEEMLEQIEETKRYYRPETLSSLVSDLEKKKVRGAFTVLFKNPRKSVFLRAIPKLLDRDIPFTVVLRPDCIGMNRLPREEELELFTAGYPEKKALFETWKNKVWEKPEEVDLFLKKCRHEIGPLPVGIADPTRYCVTWGKILEVPKKSREFALGISFSHSFTELFHREKKFTEVQIGENVEFGFSYQLDSCLSMSGLRATVTPQPGAIDATTSLFALPLWEFNSPLKKI